MPFIRDGTAPGMTKSILHSIFRVKNRMSTLPIKFGVLLVLVACLRTISPAVLTKRSISDDSVTRYLTERICVWNEVCKEEFQRHFKCKCPEYFFCRAPGRYYNAFCSMTGTGYIWMQPSFQAADV